MAKKIMMDNEYDKEIAEAIKRGKQLDKELGKGNGKKKATPASGTAKKKVKRK